MPFPSKHQLKVIEHRGGPLIVIAGPGTGKTRTLIERMMALLSEDKNREVMFVTFTRSSRRDTENRLEKAFGTAILDQPDLLFPRTSTLHGYAKRFVHRYARYISRDSVFSIPIESKGEFALILSETIDDLNLTLDVEEAVEAIKLHRATTEWPPGFSLSASERLAFVNRFELLLDLYRTLDMEGVVLAAIGILETGEVALPRIFLQVDEYQDLNPMDHLFIDHIASHPASQTVIVGDDAQSIYGSRHAHHEGVRVLWESPEWERAPFPDSFRLPAHILNAGLDLISGSRYIGAEINRKPPDDKRILTLQCTTSDLQVEAVARHIGDMMASVTEKGDPPLNYSSFLILCPTGERARRAAEHLVTRYGIPAYVPASPTIPSDIWDIILLLRILANEDPLALRQWLPFLGLSLDEIISLRDQALSRGVSFYDHCFSVEDSRIGRFRSQLDQLERSQGDFEEFLDQLSSFDRLDVHPEFGSLLSAVLDEDGSIPPLATLIHRIYQEFGVLEEEEIAQLPDQVLVTTMHKAKGLEAEFVYCLWMNSRFMPMPGRDPEEERRVLYVALTRAKKDVVVCFHEVYRGGRQGRLRQEALSPFLLEIIAHLRVIPMSAPLVRSEAITWYV
jgi:DNA helicase-2/ATP-dependent DNA helicase PcrA